MSNSVLDPTKPERSIKRHKRVETPEEAMSYRAAMLVTDAVEYEHGDQAPLCPRCNIPLDRTYQAYCDRCGQCLRWGSLRKVKVHKWK